MEEYSAYRQRVQVHATGLKINPRDLPAVKLAYEASEKNCKLYGAWR